MYVKAFNFNSNPRSVAHKDNEVCLRFAIIPKMSPKTKHIALSYRLFRYNDQELEISLVDVSTRSERPQRESCDHLPKK